MPIVISRDDTQRRFTATGSEVITATEILDLIATCRIGAYRTYALVFDIRSATISLTPWELQEFATRSNALGKTEGPLGPAAIIADRPGASALARLYERLVDARKVPPLRVVATEEEADQWLATVM
jgi:hypothetical protein